MRIIAGKYRRRRLSSLQGLTLRPTSDRLRETLFNVLGELVIGSRFIDAFAGTGAVGIEALSRGACEVIFIEKHASAVRLIKKNLETLDVRTDTRVLSADVLRGLQILAEEGSAAGKPQEILFLDPPYDNAADYHRVLSFVGSSTFFSGGAVIIAEHRHKFDLSEAVENLQRVRVLRQGDASLSFYRRVTNSGENSAGRQ